MINYDPTSAIPAGSFGRTKGAGKYCANCGRSIPTCPDCGKRFCGETCRIEHTELGSCPSHADGALTSADRPAQEETAE